MQPAADRDLVALEIAEVDRHIPHGPLCGVVQEGEDVGGSCTDGCLGLNDGHAAASYGVVGSPGRSDHMTRSTRSPR